jgi:hypothetical protein
MTTPPEDAPNLIEHHVVSAARLQVYRFVTCRDVLERQLLKP